MPKAEVAKSVNINQLEASLAKLSLPPHHPQHGIDTGIQPERAAAVGHSDLRPGLCHPAQRGTADWRHMFCGVSDHGPVASGVCWLSAYRSECRQQGGADGGAGISQSPPCMTGNGVYEEMIADPDGNRTELVGCDLLKTAYRSLYRVVKVSRD